MRRVSTLTLVIGSASVSAVEVHSPYRRWTEAPHPFPAQPFAEPDGEVGESWIPPTDEVGQGMPQPKDLSGAGVEREGAQPREAFSPELTVNDNDFAAMSGGGGQQAASLLQERASVLDNLEQEDSESLGDLEMQVESEGEAEVGAVLCVACSSSSRWNKTILPHNGCSTDGCCLNLYKKFCAPSPRVHVHHVETRLCHKTVGPA